MFHVVMTVCTVLTGQCDTVINNYIQRPNQNMCIAEYKRFEKDSVVQEAVLGAIKRDNPSFNPDDEVLEYEISCMTAFDFNVYKKKLRDNE